MTRLVDIAHARTGDKGDTSILMVAPYRAEDFDAVAQTLQPAAVAALFGVPATAVSVIASPGLVAFTVVVQGLLDGGVTRSGRLDPHGKTLAGHLLLLTVPTR